MEDLTNTDNVAAFVVVCLSVIIFRFKRADAPWDFRLPFMPLIPVFGVLDSEFLMLQLHRES
ncbi:hypothetical protein ACIGB6_06505 [Paeniglutamicibacter gangotriensis]|uniref:hypothetical protein n=1 Tax=Paeniglutamicibacter gangotriensis TaxID=254787 RepID=UPI0037CB5464